MRYVALLRGINVGGRNIIPMADLRALLDDAGFGPVETYIQSGNVLLESATSLAALEADLTAVLADHLGISLTVVLRSRRQLANAVAKAPAGFGQAPDLHLSDVVFLKKPLTSAQALSVVECREGVDRVWPGTGVLYIARLRERRSQSRFSRIVRTPEYQRMTIRNWNTTTKLLSLLDGRSAR